MQITMKTLYATPERAIAAGATAEVPDDEARDLIGKGFAVAVGADPAAGDKPAKRRPARRGRQEPDPEAVPDGTAEDVLAWVGEDTARAARAFEAEQARGDDARAELVDALRAAAGG